MRKYLIFLCVSILAQGCFGGGTSQQTTNNSSSTTKVETTATETKVVAEPKPEIKIYNVKTPSDIYSEPSSKSAKLINQKATQALGEVIYLSIDNSCKVKILETNGDWSKIQVTDPTWLTSTHIGWVKSNVIAIPQEGAPIEKFHENKDYQIFYSFSQGGVTNLRVLVLWKDFNEEKIAKLANAIKTEKSPNSKCNISIYDSKDIVPLIDKYPLKGQEYVNVADHFVYELTFDGMSLYYPFKDALYKEYGGTKPIR